MQIKYKVTWLYADSQKDYPRFASKEFDSGDEAANFIREGAKYHLNFEVFTGYETATYLWNRAASIVKFLDAFPETFDAS